MKRLFLLMTCLLMSMYGEAQSGASGSVGTPLPINPIDLKGVPIRRTASSDVEGSPYLTDDWKTGTVKFAGGGTAKNVPLRFNLLHNVVYFKKGEEEYEFAEPVQEFTLNYQGSGEAVFRNGYPAIDRNDKETFYEVLTDGKFQLLKYRLKRLQTKQGYADVQKQSYSEKEQLYALLPDGKMITVKKDKDDLIQAMPAQADAIRKIVEEKKLKLKNEEQLKQLFTLLNQPS